MEIGVDRPALAAYLARLDAAATAAGLPAERRCELLAEIRGHMDDALAGVEPTAAALADVIDRLGPVDEIVAAEIVAAERADRPGTTGAPTGAASESPRWGSLEVVAVGGLTVGSYLLSVLGSAVGLICAWLSPRWTTRQKSIATALSVLPTLFIVIAGLTLFAAGGDSTPAITSSPVSSGHQPLLPPEGATSVSILPRPAEVLIVLGVLGPLGPVGAGVFLATRGRRRRR